MVYCKIIFHFYFLKKNKQTIETTVAKMLLTNRPGSKAQGPEIPETRKTPASI
jgi:hypothetical protein